MKWVKLGDITNIRTGKLNANAADPEGEYPFFTCSITPLKINRYSYDCECVLVAGNGDLNVKYYNGKFDAYQRTYIVESLNHDILNVKYLYYFLKGYVEKLREQSIGGVIKYIKLANITNAEIPLVSLGEQKKLVNILSKSESIIDKREEQISALSSLKQSIFLDMFGDPNLSEQRKYKIGELFEVKTGSTPSRKNQMYWDNDDVPWVKTTEVDNNYINQAEEYVSNLAVQETNLKVFPENTILIAMYGQGKTRGKSGLLTFPAATNQACAAILPSDQINSIFIWYQLMIQYKTLRNLGRGGNQPNLNLNLVKNFEIILPPIDEQHKFEKIIRQIDNQINRINFSKEELKHLHESLMHKAFNGELFND